MKKSFDFISLLPFGVFLIFYLGLSLWSKDFYSVPMPVAFIAASAAALISGKASLEEKITIYARSMGESNIMLMVMIFILAGAFAAVAKSSGAVDAPISCLQAGSFLFPVSFLLLSAPAAVPLQH